ncbi:MAG TPA: hypothetical protein VFB32_01560 [Rudaea sp.]|nr:hypothetical protein [Rudaea sp.]
MRKIVLCALVLCTFGSAAHEPPPPGPGVPPADALATVPDLSAAQQIELRKILIQRRDAFEAVQTKARAEHEALRLKERGEFERIDGETSAQLRKLLGDEGYRRYAEWEMAHRGPGPGPGPGQHPPHAHRELGAEHARPAGGPGTPSDQSES